MITKKLFNGLFPTGGLTAPRHLRKYNLVRDRDKLIDALNRILPKYGIDNHLRVCAFLGNCGIETDYFKTTSEYATGWDYDIAYNRAKAHGLGNFKKGDGPKYKGGGLTQTTGKNNYEAVQLAIGAALGIDVVKNPEILRGNIDVAVESACIFWKQNNLNFYADRGQFKQLSAIVNRGDKNKTPLHWEKREALYEVCKKTIPRNFTLHSVYRRAPDSEPVVLTPTEPNASSDQRLASSPDTVSTNTVSTDIVPADTLASQEKSQVKQFSEKYLKHCPSDSVKNVLAVGGVRFTSTITTVWTMGLSGQILLIAAGLLITGFSAYALYFYAPRIIGWAKDLADPFIPGETNE
jgi:putative chitinase